MKKYFKDSWKEFAESLRGIDKSAILYVVMYNLLFWTVGFILFSKFREAIIANGSAILGLDLSQATIESQRLLASNYQVVKSFYHTMVYYIIAFVLLLLIAYILSNLFIWLKITGRKARKLKPRFVGNFFFLNLIWIVCWVAVIVALVNSMRQEAVTFWIVGLVVVYVHLTTVMYISYFKRGKVKKALKQAFSIGLGKIRYFILPYIFALLLFAVVNLVFSIFKNLPDRGYTFVASVVMLFYFAWLRTYIYSFAKKLI